MNMNIWDINNAFSNVRQNAEKGRETNSTGDTTFLDKLGRASERKTVEGASFEEMLKSKYPGVYYNVMDTSKIDGGLWGRNDYPWNAYFKEPADKSVLNWTPSGAEPSMQSAKVQSNINATLGKMAIVIPQELEEKMKNDPSLAGQVMGKVDEFMAMHYRPGENQGFLITFDENGEINHACVTGEGKLTVSSSEFVEARKAREAKRAEYERLAEKNAVKRKLFAQAEIEREYQRDAIEEITAKYEKSFLL